LEEVLATTTAADADERTLREFKNRFADLSLPERTRRELQRHIDELSRSYREILQMQERDAERAQLDQLRRWDESVSIDEAASRSDGAVTLAVPDRLFEPRLDTIDNEMPRDSLRGLAIRAELLAGAESPASEHELRLQIQVDQMNAGMGRAHNAMDPLDLAREWCVLGPKHQGCDELRARFFAALTRAMED
jgi:hypothetical protein